MKELTARQEKFCLEYAASGNTYQSAVKAGYSENYAKGNAAKLVENVRVKARLQELKEKAESEKIVDIKKMQEVLSDIIMQQLDEEVIVTEGCGDGISEARKMKKKPSVRDVINAINTLGKMQGAFVEKLNVSGNVGVTFIDDLGD